MVRFRHTVAIRRPSEVIRLGAWCAVMLEHHKRRATTSGASEGRPPVPGSRFPGASGTLDDAPASPARAFLPGKREPRSYCYHMSEADH